MTHYQISHKLFILIVILLTFQAQARVQTYFTSVEKSRMDQILISVMKKAEVRALSGRKASIDVMVFSFTTTALADEILRIASTYPDLVEVRIILDVTQLAECCSHTGPYIYYIAKADYKRACYQVCSDKNCQSDCEKTLTETYGGKELPNVSVRYWFYDAWVWDSSTKQPEYNHSKATLMHHKSVIVNHQILATGSYNWSVTASQTNYENIQIFSGTREKNIVREFQAEFDAIWTLPEKCLDTEAAKAKKAEIWDRLIEENGGN